MICMPCRTGALAVAEEDPEMAEAHHADCEAPGTCPCQHQIESVKRDA